MNLERVRNAIRNRIEGRKWLDCEDLKWKRRMCDGI
jgi:hypothetical protein